MTSTGAHGFLQQPDEEHPFGMMFDDDEVLKIENGQAKTTFHFFIPSKSYLYKEQFVVTPDDPNVQVQIDFPQALSHDDPFLEKTTEIYRGDVALPVTLTFAKDFAAKSFSGKISYQGCSDKICYRLMAQKFNFMQLHGVSSTNAGTTVAFPLLTNSGKVADAVTVKSAENSWWDKVHFEMGWNPSDSFWSKLFSQSLIALVLGLLSSFSVCVLPLVPLTISFIGAKNQSWRKTTLTLLVFVLGMISMNAPLGMLAAWLGLKFGFQYQNPWFLFGVSLMFFVMGLWMLGVFGWQLPARLQTAVSKVQSRGLLRAYFSGLTIGVMAFACIGPFVLPLLAFVSSAKNLFVGFFVMSMYSLGMSGLFVAAAFFSTGWMRTFGEKSFWFKRIGGFVMLLAGCYFGWVFVSAHVLPLWQKPQTTQNEFFQTDFATAATLAQNQNQKIIIDFYADWCLPCQEWELKVWSKPEVQKVVQENFVPLKVDCTTDTPECNALTERFAIKGMPTVLFLHADQSEIANARLVGVVLDAADFIKLLQEIQ